MRLGAIPLGVALVLTMLLLPRRAAPAFDDVPVPVPDAHALAHSAAIDHDLAERARHETLPGAVRAVGSALRAYHKLEAAGTESGPLVAARRAIDGALSDARASATAEETDAALLRLRALELEGFLVEVQRYEATGAASDEFVALAGDFAAAMKKAGWCEGHALLPREDALRTMYKEMWNALVGVEGRTGFEASLDEERALYALFLSAPHPSSAARDALDAARRGASDAKACAAVVEGERGAAEAWRADRIARFAGIDPSYPAAYALGVASYRRGDYRAAARSFRTWLDAHGDGPLTLRARAFLRAADAESHETE